MGSGKHGAHVPVDERGMRGKLSLEELSTAIEAGEIETVITAIPDLYGRLVGKHILGTFFLDEIAGDGMHVCDYLLACDMEMEPTPGYDWTSWETGYGDMRAIPDYGTLRVAAWADRTAIVICDCLEEERDVPVAVAPRTILRRQVERARELGCVPQMASELEFFLFREDYAEARRRDYRDLTTGQMYNEDYHLLSGAFAEPVIGAIRRLADASGVPVEFSKGEASPGQHELNLRYATALEMADRHVIYKTAAKEIATREGWGLTFMAKWDTNHAGSSFHIHMSFVDAKGKSIFAGSREDGSPIPGTDAYMSERFRWAVGGLLEHARSLSLLFAPNPNSYKRFRASTFAPTRVAWGYDNRTIGFRVVGHGQGLRVECRIPGGDANPYLAYAGLIAAALDGIERQVDPGPMFEGNGYEATELPRIPDNILEAIRLFEASDFARKAFGDDVVRHILRFATVEADAVESQVSDLERRRYFERM